MTFFDNNGRSPLADHEGDPYGNDIGPMLLGFLAASAWAGARKAQAAQAAAEAAQAAQAVPAPQGRTVPMQTVHIPSSAEGAVTGVTDAVGGAMGAVACLWLFIYIVGLLDYVVGGPLLLLAAVPVYFAVRAGVAHWAAMGTFALAMAFGFPS